MRGMASVYEEACALAGARIRQYYPGYGAGEPNETQGKYGKGIFAGTVTEVWKEDKPFKGERAIRVVLQITYEDHDVDDISFKQFTAMTRGRKGPSGEEGYAKAPVIVEDELQDRKVVNAVREAAVGGNVSIDEESGDTVRQFACQLQVREEMFVLSLSPEAGIKMKKRMSHASGSEETPPQDKKPNASDKKKADTSGQETTANQSGSSTIRNVGGLSGTKAISRPEKGSGSDHLVQAGGSKGRATITRESSTEFRDDVMFIAQDKFLLSIMCPITMRRIVEPAKGQDCAHKDCFDKDTFIEFQKKFTVTRVNMVRQVFSEVVGLSEGQVEVVDVDEESRFKSDDRAAKNAVFVNVNVALPGGDTGQIISKFEAGHDQFLNKLRKLAVKDEKSFSFLAKNATVSIQAVRKASVKNDGFRLRIPVEPVECPLCKMKIWSLQVVKAMKDLLSFLKNDEVRESVYVDGDYNFVGDGGIAKRRRVHENASGQTTPRDHPGQRPQQSIGSEPGGVTLPSEHSKMLPKSAAPRVLDDAQSAGEIPRRMEQAPQGFFKGTLKQFRQGNNGWFGFIFGNPLDDEGKGIYAGERAFARPITAEIKRMLQTSERDVKYSLRRCTGAREGKLEATNITLEDSTDSVSKSSLFEPSLHLPSSVVQIPSEPIIEEHVLQILQSGCFLGNARLMLPIAIENYNTFLTGVNLNFTHTMAEDSLPVSKLKFLKWTEVVPCCDSQTIGIQKLCEELVSDNRCGVGSFRKIGEDGVHPDSPTMLFIARGASLFKTLEVKTGPDAALVVASLPP